MKWSRVCMQSVGVAAVVCCSGMATAQQSVGADVTVGELPDITNNAAVGSLDSFAVGTTSCNKGNVPLNWFTGGTDNRHPVIGQNLFRLHNGRFEHIGQAWLKHGFTALQGTVCQTQFGFNCSPTAGTTLGIGCSDPYSSGLNNGQSGLGPKWQVNASTGLFPYPFAGSSQSSFTAHERRLQFDAADVSSTTYPGARYFVEGHYIGGDDALAGNDNNNASYREVTYNGSGFTITSSTAREKPAIQAWKDVDPTVTIVTADIAGDGRFLLGAKVTQSGSNYTYEYALQNLSSHRSAQAFAVPFPSGTSVSGVGFRQPAYHSGEPNQGQPDWTSSTAATQISWSGPAHSGTAPVYTVSSTDPLRVTNFTPGTGNDHSANALRWGTLYNFRFTTTVAPAAGSVQVTMFRPGTPTSFTMNVPTPGGATFNASTGVCCTGTTCTVTTAAACSGVFGEIGGSCSPNPCVSTSGACCATSGACTVTSSASSCTGTFLQGTVCNPNPCPQPVGACCTAGVCSQTTAANCAGSFAGANVPCGPATCLNNDLCAAARALCDGVAVTGSTASATFSDTIPATCGSSSSSPDLWFTYAPSGTSGTVSVSIRTCGSDYDTVIAAYTGNCGSLVQVTCNDDSTATCGSGTLQSNINVTMNRGQTYRIRLSGFSGATGNYSILVTGGGGTGCNAVPTGSCCITGACTVVTQANCTGNWTSGGVCSPNPCPQPTGACCTGGTCATTTQAACNGAWTSGGACSPNPCPPLNDDCANRAGLGLGTQAFDTTNATTDGVTHSPACLFFNNSQIYKDIWFNHPSQGTGTLVIDTCGTTFDTKIAVYDGFGCLNYETRLMACNDDDTTCGANSLQSRVSIPVVAGGFYTIRVGAYSPTGGGAGQLNLTFTPAPVNGSCCVGTTCSVVEQANCTGTWTSGGSCGPVGNPTTCCPANFNQVDGVDINDIFQFLNAWFAGSPSSDFNGGGVDINDIFDYLNAWFVGC